MTNTEKLSDYTDLNNGGFYVRIVIDGQAKLTAVSLCSICLAMVPAGAINEHHDWHDALPVD